MPGTYDKTPSAKKFQRDRPQRTRSKATNQGLTATIGQLTLPAAVKRGAAVADVTS